jgi:glycosyltransferase involved in cell wall biosynthesis
MEAKMTRKSLSSTPRVTLAMPVYNGQNFLHKSIESILTQSFTDFELIVSDNASSDSTCEIVESYQRMDNRIRLLKNTRNIGAAANYNLGYQQAKGEYLKWCAHDYEIDRTLLQHLVSELDGDQNLSLAFGKTVCIDEEGREIPTVGMEAPEILDDDPAVRFIKALVQLGTCFPIFGLFRKNVLEKTTLHRPYYSSDKALLAEVALLGKIGFVPAAIFFNREHKQRSINLAKSERSAWQNGTKSRYAAAEHLNLLRHYFEIARRHPNVAPPLRLTLAVIRYGLEPLQLGRYITECAGLVSPSAERMIKRSAGRMLGRREYS